ncbi:TATA box-binding protein-associated factor, RNA polymerase I, subunit C-like [Patiria miniata]|uniref:TATA box-binding protein-associated factor RNA polymerase I subunit C n=1 Tax=Patiria miniata TaxID=46514 RepID=A0A914BBA0_PATMI|nr:TATA box-binding protein-associated factor, RNA polymerase I, subunit C-like [Patiria miniata]XP_038073493.1 TATA box-binding protein-associated factor, RNA polymerase I, subunit C-like [Patiria miniata]XP_038073494.1 TATA box-binding protein-associated factor, RNA polymerase I, subunit C-like [Patiria miniata]
MSSSAYAFPDTHFPSQTLPNRQTQLPDGYGCYHAADLDTDNRQGMQGELRFRFQYRHGNEGMTLVANEPTLPLLQPQECCQIPLPGMQDLTRVSTIYNTRQIQDRAVDQAYYFYENFPDLVWGSALDFLKDSYIDYEPRKRRKSKKRRVDDATRNLFEVRTEDKLSQLHEMLEPVLYDINPNMLLRLLKEDVNENIHKLYVDQDFYGGCLAYQSLPASSVHEGLIFYPTGPTLEVLNIRTVPHQGVPIYSMKSSPCRQFKLVSPLRQIETVSVPYRGAVVAGLRSDYYFCLMKVTTTKNKIKARVSNFIHSQQKIASVAVSPFIHGECLLGLDTGAIQLVSPEKGLTCVRAMPALEEQSTCRCHYGGHPRCIVVQQKKHIDLVDFRAPEDSGSSCLLSIPSENLPEHQEVFVAKQHPSNHFYHLVATQDLLLLLDERYPKYNVLQWCHMLNAPPNFMDIIPQAVTSDDLTSDPTSNDLTSDLIVLASQCSREVHCFQCSELNGCTPVSTSQPWKIASTDGWFDMLPEYPPVDLDPVRSRLERPLIGVSGAKRTSCAGCEPGVTVFQLSTAGDLFFQTYSQKSCTDDRQDKTLSRGPGCPNVQLGQESLTNCKAWIEGVLRQSVQEPEPLGFKTVDREIARNVFKSMTFPEAIPSKDCTLCKTPESWPLDDQSTDRSQPTDRSLPCPACGVEIVDSAEFQDCLEAGEKIIFRRRGIDEEGEEAVLPGKIDPKMYPDEMSKTLHRLWLRGYDGDDDDDDDSDKDVNQEADVVPKHPHRTHQPSKTSQVSAPKRQKSADATSQDAPDGRTAASQSLDTTDQQRAADLQRIRSARLSKLNWKVKFKRGAMGF